MAVGKRTIPDGPTVLVPAVTMDGWDKEAVRPFVDTRLVARSPPRLGRILPDMFPECMTLVA